MFWKDAASTYFKKCEAKEVDVIVDSTKEREYLISHENI